MLGIGLLIVFLLGVQFGEIKGGYRAQESMWGMMNGEYQYGPRHTMGGYEYDDVGDFVPDAPPSSSSSRRSF